MAERNVSAPENFTNRELSWLAFDSRILSEARDRGVPVFDRLKFAAITASNLDEFFMVRVASLKDMVHAGYKKPDLAGMTPQQQLFAVNQEARTLVDGLYSCYRRSLVPTLKKDGICLIDAWEELSEEQAAYCDAYFEERVYPVLTPMAVDASRPFPLIQNKTLNIAALLKPREGGSELQARARNAASAVSTSEGLHTERLTKDLTTAPRSETNPESSEPPDGTKGKGDDHKAGQEKKAAEGKSSEKKASKKDGKGKKEKKAPLEFATVQVPSVLPRLVELPSEEGQTFVLLEQIIERNLARLFLRHEVICAAPYRVMRNADLSFDEDEAPDLLKEIQKKLRNRRWGEVIRLEAEAGADQKLLKHLTRYLAVEDADIFAIPGPVDLTFLMKLSGLEGYDALRVPDYEPAPHPQIPEDADLFSLIRKQDLFLHHPYQTFAPVVDLIRQAAVDEQVLAIKMTLYRVSRHSPIIAALEQAAELGKQVTVLVELKARFDEENNIVWAQQLERAGCHVIYGLAGLKTHSKIALVVRQEESGIRRYVHLGTGNYNDSTARLYTDCGLLTCSEPIGEDASAVFNMLSGFSEPARWNRLLVAPIWMRNRFLALVRREIAHAEAGRCARIIAKMNSLCDRTLIEALYEASCSGVEIDLIVRGICCLRPQVPGLSENIRVRSIVGTFLEHARIFSFANGGSEEIYMGSADWMPRNMDRRVEIVFPLDQEETKAAARHVLDIQLSDNVKAYELGADGRYSRPDRRGHAAVCAQETFMEEAKATTRAQLR